MLLASLSSRLQFCICVKEHTFFILLTCVTHSDMSVAVPPWCSERLSLSNRENLCFSKLKSEINYPFDVTGMLEILRSQSL